MKTGHLADLPANRTVYQADALMWLDAHFAPPNSSVVTSLPDYSELSHLSFEQWRQWFVDTARKIMRWVSAEGVAIFYQSDIRHHGRWIDKGSMIAAAGALESADMIWHKIVCRKPPGTVSIGRPSYSHMICFSATTRPSPTRPGPDVIADAGFMSWPRAMGENACRVACRFLQDETQTKTVIDPFCGQGSILAMANSLGMNAIGIDLSPRRCRVARKAQLQSLLPQ